MLPPLFSSGKLNLYHKLLFIVAPQPIVPAIDTHDGIIEIDGSLTKKVAFETEVNIKDGAYQPCWVNPDAFFS